MRKLPIILVATLVTLLKVNAQTEKSLLWEISGNGLTESSYIYGTIHLICPNDFILNDVTKNVFHKSKQVFLELDFDDPQLMTQMQSQLVLTNGKTLKDYCSEEDYLFLDKYFTEKIGVGMNVLSKMKPLSLMSMIYMTILQCQPASYEAEFTKLAATESKEVLGLETVSEQMEAFDKIPYEEQMQLLTDMVRNEEKGKNEFEEIITTYKNQNLTQLLELIIRSDWNSENFEQDLIVSRNKKWIPIMEKESKKMSTFFAIGAGHLAGTNGVLNLLKEKGFTVNAIKK